MIDISSDGNQELIQEQGGNHLIEAKNIADHFVREILKIRPTSSLATNPQHLIEKAMNYVGTASPKEQFKRFRSQLHPDRSTELHQIVESLIEDRLRCILRNGDLARATVANLPIQAPTVEEPAVSVSVTAATSSKRSRPEVVKNDLPERHSLRTMTSVEEKVKTMQKLFEDQAQKPLTGGAKSFASKFLKPMMSCLNCHMGGDITKFVNKYPSYTHTTFPTLCCEGTGSVCIPKKK